MRRWFFLLHLWFLVAQDYVCSVADFNRFVGLIQVKVEQYYSRVTISSAQLSDALTYSSVHKEFSPAIYHTSDLTPCPAPFHDQFSMKGAGKMIGIFVSNRTTQGVAFDWDVIESEIRFVTPIINFFPTMLKHIPDSANVYVVGADSACSSFYMYPGGDFCGILPMLDMCEYLNKLSNVFSTKENLEDDYNQGGHWSDPYVGKAGVVLSYSVPVKDANQTIRGQLAIGLGINGIAQVIESSRPSKNGHMFIMTQAGHLVYASQIVIDILFGKAANLTLSELVSAWAGRGERASPFTPFANPAISVASSTTPFSILPSLIVKEKIDIMLFEGYYITWTRFHESLKTWFLIGLIPQNEIDDAAVWRVDPPLLEVTLTEGRPEMRANLTVINSGVLPLHFSIGDTQHTSLINVNISEDYRDRRYVEANSSQSVDVLIQFNPHFPVDFTTSQLIIPFFAEPFGYGPCFRPLSSKISVQIVQTKRYVPAVWAITTIDLLCGLTILLILTALFFLFFYRYSAPVLALAPRLCLVKLISLLLIVTSSIINILPPTLSTCEAARWLLNIGYASCLSSITVKNYRNRQIFACSKLPIAVLTDRQLLAVVAAVVLLDIVFLVVATVVEPYVLMDGKCKKTGWIAFSLLLTTKVCLLIASFWNTIKTENIPSAFADSHLNIIFICIAIMGLVSLALQFSRALIDVPGIEIFLNSLFVWVGACLISCHLFTKVRAGYVMFSRPSIAKRGSSTSISIGRQQGLREKLEALLAEVEAHSQRLRNEKTRAIETGKANERLMVAIRAELLALNTQAHLSDEELEQYIPTSIKTALEKYGPAISRRLDATRPASPRPVVNRPREQGVVVAPMEGIDENNQLLGMEPMAQADTSPSQCARMLVHEEPITPRIIVHEER